MSDSEAALDDYKHGDIAWVKLGTFWWPGEVVDLSKLPDSVKSEVEASIKNKPTVIVKFFQEDSYEFVHKGDRIYPYNCPKKYEFVKKGIDLHRAKKPNMEKFPEDIGIAEKRTNGDENILEDPKFAPPMKNESYKELFGTPKPQKRSRGRQSLKNTTPKTPPTPSNVMHPRFTGVQEDHLNKKMIQPKGDTFKVQSFKCSKCEFITMRINALVLHNRTHLKSAPLYNTAVKKGRKRGPRKSLQMASSKTNSIDEDIALLEKGLPLDDDETPSDDDVKKKKRRRRRKRMLTKGQAASNKTLTPNITNDLLAEWDDDDTVDADEDKSIDDDSLNGSSILTDSVNSSLLEESFEQKSDADAAEATAKVSMTSEKRQDDDTTRSEPKHEPRLVDSDGKTDFDEVIQLLEATKVPEVPIIPATKKDDKSPSKIPEIATKLTNPKKRFVKSFEDFELSMKEKEKLESECIQSAVDEDKNKEDDIAKELEKFEDLKEDLKKRVEDQKKTTRQSATKERSEEGTVTVAVGRKTRRSDSKCLDIAVSKENELEALKKVDEIPKVDETIDKEVEEEAEKSDSELLKKSTEDAKAPKRDDKATTSSINLQETKTKRSKDLDKHEKHARKESKSKEKPKEKILTEIDVFESLRAQEEEKYNKKSDDSPRRETRASRSKTRSESTSDKKRVDSPKLVSSKRNKRQESEEAQVNNGKTDESNQSPLISKMKNKLMNMLNTDLEPAESAAKSSKHRKRGRRSLEVDESDKTDSQTDEEAYEPSEKKPVSYTKTDEKKEVNKDASKSLDSGRRLRNAPFSEQNNEEPTDSKRKSATKLDSKPSLSAKVDAHKSGPKTYLRASKSQQVEKEKFDPARRPSRVSTPLASPTSQESKKVSSETPKIGNDLLAIDFEADISSANVKQVVIGDLTITTKQNEPASTSSQDVAAKETLVNDVLKKEIEKTPPDANEENLMKSVSPAKKSTLQSKDDQSMKAKSVGKCPTKSSAPITVTLGSPSKVPSSPAKSQKVLASPVKSATPIKSLPKEEIPTTKTIMSPRRRSTSPLKSPANVSGSPIAKRVPIKSPPIVLNKEIVKSPESPSRTSKKEMDVDASVVIGSIKSPRRISLTSQEISIDKATDKVEVTEKSNDDHDAQSIKQAFIKSDDQSQSKTENITFVPEYILAEGQVEIAKIVEDGTEKVASVATVVCEKMSEQDEEEDDDDDEFEDKEENAEDESGKTMEEELDSLITSPIKKSDVANSKIIAEQDSTSKLLDILTDNKGIRRTPSTTTAKPQQQQVPLPKVANPRFEVDAKKQSVLTSPKQTKVGAGMLSPGTSKAKPTILSDTLIKSADSPETQQAKVKRTYDEIDDIEKFIVAKHPKKDTSEEVEAKKPVAQNKSKLKILDNTIVTPAGQAKKPPPGQQTTKVGTSKSVEEKVYDLLNSPKSARDDDKFDIDNMPIFLSDQILTSEAIDAMSSVSSEQLKSTIVQTVQPAQSQIKVQPKQIFATSALKTTPTAKTFPKIVKGQRVYQTTSSLNKQSATVISQGNKPGKFVIVPSASATPPGNKYTVGKRQVPKKPAILSTAKPSTAVAEPTGNKIMIVTDNKGHQSRVLLTPEHQKLMGYQAKKGVVQGTSTVTTKTLSKSTSPMSPTFTQLKKRVQSVKPTLQGQKVGKSFLSGSLPSMKSGQPGATRTVIIKNQHGQIVNRIHGTSDEDIEKQVAEQLEAIGRASNAKMQGHKGAPIMKRIIKKVPSAPQESRPGMHKIPTVAATATRSSSSSIVPPLAPITPVKKLEQQKVQQKAATATSGRVASTSNASKAVAKQEQKEDRPLKQLVIQDAMGNETTIVEGQILALPSETYDGQPQSYMLVTLDESGNLTPLNNEALMSLDRNLNLGGDLSNIVLQIDGGNNASDTSETSTSELSTSTATSSTLSANEEMLTQLEPVPMTEQLKLQSSVDTASDNELQTEQMHAVSCSITKGDTQQQLIITGDPIATQKFIESLSEGNPEIANLLANAEGSQILIHTDGQQILINTDSDNPMLLALNQDAEGGVVDARGSTIFSSASESSQVQDILAAALADTDVIQPEQSVSTVKGTQSQVSPGYPMGANNVLETSTVNSPIMSPLEVPSANGKKIETDVLSTVSKNVDLPITITDPNIAQTVNNQQVLMAGELASTMDLPLSIQDVPSTSGVISSPTSFAYALSSMDDSEKFTSPISMPLLTDDPEEIHTTSSASATDSIVSTCETSKLDTTLSSQPKDAGTKSTTKASEGTEYLLATSSMCSISNQISSLSEPPPDMFDFPIEQAYDTSKQSDSAFGSSSVDSTNLLDEGGSPKRSFGDDDEDSTDGSDAKRTKLM